MSDDKLTAGGRPAGTGSAVSAEPALQPADERYQVTRKDLRRAAWRYNFMACNLFNYETQQGPAVAWSLAPVLRKLYRDDADFTASLDNHFNYFNSTVAMSDVILGAALAMEAKDGIGAKEAVQSLKTSLMGPFAGIGDTLVWVLWPTIVGAISGYMAQQGNPLGAIFWLVANVVFWFVKIRLFEVGFRSGTKLITGLGEKIGAFTDAASIMGLTVVGAIVATSVKITAATTFKIGEVSMGLQKDILDAIMPSLLPACLTALVYVLLGSKKWTATKLILLIIAISLACSFLGILKA